ncbi:Uncharacterised protein [Mycobacteroides abscessus subsp. abscessus]|nr:Uncharacterised protein [Mycobacteroides abscessus subsp. abscessus]
MSPAARAARVRTAVLRAGSLAGAGVDAEQQTACVHEVGHCLHAVRKTGGVRAQFPRRVASRIEPAVVDHHIPISGIAHSRRHHGLRRPLDALLINIAAEHIP